MIDWVHDYFRDKKWVLVKLWYNTLLYDVWKWKINPNFRYYILKELNRHRTNVNSGRWAFIPDIQALLESIPKSLTT